jgi:hypothetical protein
MLGDSDGVEGIDEVVPGKVREYEGGSEGVIGKMADEDQGDVEEGENVHVAYAEEVDFGGLDEEAKGGST